MFQKKMLFQLKIIVVLLFLYFVTEIVGQCFVTNDKGPMKNVACAFPFKFNNIFYETCTNALDPDNLFW